MMQLRLLGSFELRRIDGARIALPGRQSVAVIACLGLAEVAGKTIVDGARRLEKRRW
jgi:hypothetical protein